MSHFVSTFRTSKMLDDSSGVFLGEHGDCSIWQTLPWNRCILDCGYESEGFIVASESLYGVFEKRAIGFGKFALFCIGGPVIKVSKSASESQEFEQEKEEWAKAVQNLAVEEAAVFVQIEPLSEMDFPDFSKWAYKKFIEPYTIVIDLAPTPEEILAQMKEKGRYNIKLAQKRGVIVEFGKPTKENIAVFLGLFEETLARDGFSGNSRGYYEKLLAYLESENLGGLFIARNSSGIPMAAAISVFFGKTALYYYGASSSAPELRRDMGAYLLQWEMMMEAKRRGCETYDFLGIAPEGSVGHHLEGVTDFKKKFGGRVIVWPEGRIWVAKKREYFLLQTMRKLKNLFRK